MVLFWIFVFIISLAALVKSADYLVDSAKSLGIHFGLSSFIVGVLVVGFGTSAPELASAFAALLKGAPELIVANAVGSNIANIFLIVGLSAILAKNIKVSKILIDLDIPLLLSATALFLALAYDGSISQAESGFLLAGLLYYLTYSVSNKENIQSNEEPEYASAGKSTLVFILSLLALIFSSKYLIDSTLALSSIFNIPASSITLFAVALGTSLPELMVSVSAIKKGESDMALGNIFGSNAFNLLAVVGLPAAFASLPISQETMNIALPTLLLATVLFAFSGISKKIHTFEGVFYLIIYTYFIGKIFALI